MYNFVHNQMGSKFWPQEMIELNDCLYRNLNRHDYIAIIDVDEMIIPQKVSTWQELLLSIEVTF